MDQNQLPDETSSMEEQNVRRFNESFYRSAPGDFLRTRLQLLLLAGGRGAEVERLLSDGVEYAGVTFKADTETERTKEETDGPDLDDFLAIESQQLLHHACETAIRLFLVHAEFPSVPWVSLAAERSFARFKQRVRAEILESTPSPELVGAVLLGRQLCPDEVDEEQWAAAIEGLSSFLTEFARCFLDDAGLYNAIKHGLGVRAGETGLALNDRGLGMGPSIDFPESGTWDEGRRDWSLTTQWIDIQQSLGMVHVAIRMIESIWAVGRFRCLGIVPTDERFFPVTLRPSSLRGVDRPPMRRMSWRLVFEERPDK